jgi:hypothetical protein
MNLEAYYEVMSDNETLKEFDPFLAGDAAERLLKAESITKYQLTGINSVSDLFEEHEDESLIEYEDILLGKDEEILTDKDQIRQEFFKLKKKYLNQFDYIKVLSQRSNTICTEYQLVVTDSDLYLLDYLLDNIVLTLSLLDSLAQLLSWSLIGAKDVKFFKKCECSFCESLNGSVYNIDVLIQKIGNGINPLHRNCDLYFIPIMNSFKYAGKSFKGFEVVDCPVEFLSILESKNYKGVIQFKDFTKVKSWRSECVVQQDSVLLVHNGYIDKVSPIEFLDEWFSTNDEFSDENSSNETIYYKGRQVNLVKGVYIDSETGEVLEV